jgi:hypothetical protein
LGEKVWVKELTSSAPAPPEPVDVCEAPEEPAIEPSAVAVEMIEPTTDLADEEPSRPKRARRLAKSPDDLPRGKRWKRRLPQAAW